MKQVSGDNHSYIVVSDLKRLAISLALVALAVFVLWLAENRWHLIQKLIVLPA